MLEVSGLFKRENHFLRIYCFYFRSFQPSPQNPRWHTGNTIWKNLTSGKTPKDILLRGIPEEIPEKNPEGAPGGIFGRFSRGRLAEISEIISRGIFETKPGEIPESILERIPERCCDRTTLRNVEGRISEESP